MKRILTSKLLHLISLMMVALGSQAQERLYDLNVNNALGNYEEYLRSTPLASRAVVDTLDLPFFDDFSEPFSRLRTVADDYPNSDIWIGNTVYINNHMAINPISQGVATFDGLDEQGRAYNFGFSLSSLSDSLVSKCLRLEGAADTVYLSFHYQAQGLGNAPEEEDRLIVEFKDTSDTWNQVWEAEGYILEDFDFQRAMIPVTDTAYLFDGFQFRFMNYASLSGNVDHWHVDYVELDGGRSIIDTMINDIAYLGQTNYSTTFGIPFTQTNSLLSEFSAMPWTHYKESSDSTEYMLDTLHIALRNNFNVSKQIQFIYRIRDEQGLVDYAYESVTGLPVLANVVCGSELGDCDNDPFNNFRTGLDSYHFDRSATGDSTYFSVEYVIDTINDAVPSNDISVFKQEFYNYYAYDDGTAEAAYGLGELENVGRVAVKFETKYNAVDYVRAIQLYLNPVEFDLSQELVQLVVWDGAEEPTSVLWMSDPLFLSYSTRYNPFHHYKIDEEVPISPGQNVWVGWIQQPATNLKFSVGFDKRTDRSDKSFYNLGSGWNQSSIPGSIMIRPSFGDAYDWVEEVGVDEKYGNRQLNIYPNPSMGAVYVQEQFSGQLSNAAIQVFDLSGRTVYNQTGYSSALNLHNLNKGVYILRVDTESASYTNRLVLQ